MTKEKLNELLDDYGCACMRIASDYATDEDSDEAERAQSAIEAEFDRLNSEIVALVKSLADMTEYATTHIDAYKRFCDGHPYPYYAAQVAIMESELTAARELLTQHHRQEAK